MSRLTFLDAAFLQMESPEAPAHVAGLQIYEPPADYDGDFLQDLIAEFSKAGQVVPPFNQRLAFPTIKLFNRMPYWETDPEFDLNYHVRFAALPRPGTMDQLFTLIERLHSRQLDQTRPLWEAYCIEGLEGGRIALYMKMHHSVIDGVSGMKMLAQMLSTDPNAPLPKAPWQVDTRKPTDPDVEPPQTAQIVNSLRKTLSRQLSTLPEISGQFGSMLKQFVGLEEGHLAVPFTAPSTPFNTNITPHRRFAVGTISLSELKQVGDQLGGTINDVVLAVCAGALREYLKSHRQLPNRPLITACPVSLRPQGAAAGGNQISTIMVQLATHIPDPIERFKQIKASADEAKHNAMSMSKEAQWNFAIVANGMNLAMQAVPPGLMPPPMNVVISNVPGPRETLYLYGARLINNYPVSLLMHGQALNITVTSYEDKMDFGLLADRKAMPDLSYLARLVNQAFEELQGYAATYEKPVEVEEDAEDVNVEAAE